MCLYPRMMENPKYKENKKNGGKIPPINDKRFMYITIGCGRCEMCMRKKTNSWKQRLIEEVKSDDKGKFVSLTFSNESYKKLYNEVEGEGYEKDNRIATLAVRRWLERIRKTKKKSIKHWLITELGSGETEHIHLHGIVWCEQEDIDKWGYGFVWDGNMINEKKENYVNEKTANYVTKYMLKVDEVHPNYKCKILCSKGIGKNYIDESSSKDFYRYENGSKTGLSQYYKDKLLTDVEKEEYWLNGLNSDYIYICGIKVNKWNSEEVIHTRKRMKESNKLKGYGGEYDVEKFEEENERRKIFQLKRIKNDKM